VTVRTNPNRRLIRLQVENTVRLRSITPAELLAGGVINPIAGDVSYWSYRWETRVLHVRLNNRIRPRQSIWKDGSATTEDYAFRASRSWINLPFTVQESCLRFGAGRFCWLSAGRTFGLFDLCSRSWLRAVSQSVRGGRLLPPRTTPIHSIIVT